MFSRLVVNVVALALLAVSAAAQAKSGATTAPYQPPLLRFDEKGLSLIDAVRLTLAHEPTIKLRDSDVEYQSGVVREAAGTFDWTFNGSADLQYSQEELRDTVKQQQQQQRDDLDRAIPIVTAKRDAYNRAIANINSSALSPNPRAVNLSAGIQDTDVKNEMDLLQSQLILVQDMINSTANPQLRQDFTDLRNQAVDRSRRRFTAAYEEIKNEPEHLRQLRQDLGDTPEDQWSRKADLQMELTKLFRSGISFTPYADVAYSSANYVGKHSWDPTKGGLGVKDLYRLTVGFDVVLPLGRGRGRADIAATETAAKIDMEARRLLVVQQQTDSVLQTVLAYWDLRAAAEQLDVYERSVKLQADLLNLTRQLIKAKDAARADEARVLASYADSQARFEAGQRRLGDARVNLARVIGVAVDDPRVAPLAADAFPQPPDGLNDDAQRVAEIARAAISRRFDQRAAVKAQESGQVLVRGAKLETRRVLDLTGGFWGTSIGEEKPKAGSWSFRSVRAGLDLEVPLHNDLQQGRLIQQQAGLRQATIDATDSARVISLNVIQLASALRLAGERVKRAEEAVHHYDRTIEDERAKLRGGDSTLINTILTEQQTTAARLARVSAQQEYAGLLARLRYEAGLLVEESGGGGSVAPANVMAVPSKLIGPAAQK